MFFVKYGYEFMQGSDFSFGLDTAVLFGMAGIELSEIGDFDALGFGNTLGVFCKSKNIRLFVCFIKGRCEA